MVSFAVKTPPQHGTWAQFLEVWRAADEIDADPDALADRARSFGAAGVDLVVFSMRGPYEARLLQPLADALLR